MLDKLDVVFASIWRGPLRILCGFSGKSNFYWARAMAFLGAICLWVGSILSKNLFDILLSGYLSYCAGNLARVAGDHDKKLQASETLEFPLSEQSIEMRIVMHATLVLLAPILVIAGVYGKSIYCFLFCIVIYMYWMSDIQLPSKSWARRALDWLKEHRPRFAPVHPPAFPIPG